MSLETSETKSIVITGLNEIAVIEAECPYTIVTEQSTRTDISDLWRMNLLHIFLLILFLITVLYSQQTAENEKEYNRMYNPDTETRALLYQEWARYWGAAPCDRQTQEDNLPYISLLDYNVNIDAMLKLFPGLTREQLGNAEIYVGGARALNIDGFVHLVSFSIRDMRDTFVIENPTIMASYATSPDNIWVRTTPPGDHYYITVKDNETNDYSYVVLERRESEYVEIKRIPLHLPEGISPLPTHTPGIVYYSDREGNSTYLFVDTQERLVLPPPLLGHITFLGKYFLLEVGTEAAIIDDRLRTLNTLSPNSSAFLLNGLMIITSPDGTLTAYQPDDYKLSDPVFSTKGPFNVIVLTSPIGSTRYLVRYTSQDDRRQWVENIPISLVTPGGEIEIEADTTYCMES